MAILRIRKLADKSTGERVQVPDLRTVVLRNGETVQVPTGGMRLVNPDTPGVDHEPWPLAGVRVEGEAPAQCAVPTSWVAAGKAEGWLTVEGERVVHRPGGPPGDVWRITHTLPQADAIVLHTVDGDLRYAVTHQPDKYADPGDDDTPVSEELYAAGATRVDWFLGLQLVTEG